MVTKFEKPVGTEIGNLASLATTDKSSVVGAINSLNSKTTFSTPPSSDSSSLSDDAAIAVKAFQAAPENSSGFRCQDSTGAVRYCTVFKRISAGGVIVASQDGTFKYFTISNGAVIANKSYDIGALNSNITAINSKFRTGTRLSRTNVNKFEAFTGTTATNASGKTTLDITELGLSAKPSIVIANCTSHTNVLLQYEYDDSSNSATQIVLSATNTVANSALANETIRYTAIIVA